MFSTITKEGLQCLWKYHHGACAHMKQNTFQYVNMIHINQLWYLLAQYYFH